MRFCVGSVAAVWAQRCRLVCSNRYASDGADARAVDCTASMAPSIGLSCAVKRKFFYSALFGKTTFACGSYRGSALTRDAEHRDH